MAHTDYHCCAVCDSKLEYGGLDSTTKEQICPVCLKHLRAEGLSILDVDEFLEWLKNTERHKIFFILCKINFRFCRYLNEVDTTVKEQGIIEDEKTRLITSPQSSDRD